MAAQSKVLLQQYLQIFFAFGPPLGGVGTKSPNNIRSEGSFMPIYRPADGINQHRARTAQRKKS